MENQLTRKDSPAWNPQLQKWCYSDTELISGTDAFLAEGKMKGFILGLIVGWGITAIVFGFVLKKPAVK